MSTLGGPSPGLQGPGLQGIAEPMYGSARGNACVACKSVRFEEVWTRARTTARGRIEPVGDPTARDLQRPVRHPGSRTYHSTSVTDSLSIPARCLPLGLASGAI